MALASGAGRALIVLVLWSAVVAVIVTARSLTGLTTGS